MNSAPACPRRPYRYRLQVAVVLLAAAGVAADAIASTSGTTLWRIDIPEVVLIGVPFAVTLEDTAGLGDGPVRLWLRHGDDAGAAGPASAVRQVHQGKAVWDSVRVGSGATSLVLATDTIRQEVPLRVLPGWLTLLPPLLAITLALVTRQVVVALLLGIWVGAWILFDFNPLVAFLRLGDRFLVTALADRSHATILLFSTILGGMVGILSRSGATEGVVRFLARKVKGRRGGQISTAMMGTAIFFDDYANTLLVGNTMRPLTDRLRVSREKLSYLVDSTAAPVATVAVISTWVGFEVGLIQDAMAQHSAEGSAYTFFLRSIPYGYYPLLTLLFVYLVAGLGRDFGPMLTAEKRAFRSGEVLRPGAQPASDTRILEGDDTGRSPAHPMVAVVPIGVVVLVTGLGLWFDGRQTCLELGMARPTLRQILNHADSYAALMWACLSGAVVAGGLACGTRRLSLQQTVQGWLAGAKAMLIAIVILILAWSLSEVCNVLQTAQYLVQVCQAGLPAQLLPAVVFLLAAAIGFATGTSWGTMAILMPLVYPLGLSLPEFAGLDPGVGQGIHLAAVSAVLAGSVFGDHCSPISDTTILSSLASGADHVDHVRTQLPYAAVVALVAVLTGYLPVGWGLPPWVSLLTGAVILFLGLLWLGRRSDTVADSP